MQILNFGSVNIDHVYQVPHFLLPGETLSSLDYQVKLGGKGFNQSVALANAGAAVFHAGCIGGDGLALQAYLQARGVHTEFLRVLDGVPTGHTVIEVDPSGQNRILLYGGANGCVTAEQIGETLNHFQQGDYLLLQNELSCLDILISEAHKRGLKIVLNPSPISDALLQMRHAPIDWLILNEIEGAAFCDVPDTHGMLCRLHECFPETSIVLTLGQAGSECWHGGHKYACPAHPVTPVDTTAAGDTYTGYFIAGIIDGADIPAAMELATEAAAVTVTRSGAAESIPTKSELVLSRTIL
jgi:ribokinase